MSITQTLSNAFSGLTAASRHAEIVSNNVSNVATDGYARREIELSARTVGDTGNGVSVDGVRRVVDQALLRDRRQADASAAEAGVRSSFHADLEKLIGIPDDAASLSGRVAKFEASLLEASSRPDSQARLGAVLDSAQALAGSLGSITDGIQQQRLDADGAIARQVKSLNTNLARVQELNERIVSAEQRDRDSSGLVDQRQKVIDDIASIVPLKQIEHPYGRVELQTTSGAVLVDRKPATVGFKQANVITAGSVHDPATPGGLSGLTLNGEAVATTGRTAPLGGGSLSAEFERRDALAPAAQAEIDAVARNLVERFSDAAVDPTLGGQVGLFTDAGAALVPGDEVGLAGRIAVNAEVDPAQGGKLSRLRDGVGAAAEGDAGNAAQLTRFADALAARSAPPSGSYTVAQSLSGHVGSVLSGVGAARQAAETESAHATAQAQGLKDLQAAQGVDTDQEMQKLMLIEQAYSANARVMSVADQMIQRLLEI